MNVSQLNDTTQEAFLANHSAGEAAICRISVKHSVLSMFYLVNPPKVRKTLSGDYHWPVLGDCRGKNEPRMSKHVASPRSSLIRLSIPWTLVGGEAELVPWVQ
jgi:hypothetical protein